MVDNSFDCEASNLLCTEAESLCFDDLETVSEVVDEKIHQINDKDLSLRNGRSGLSLHLPCLSEEKFCFMVEKERDHLPKDDYLKRLRAGDIDMSLRRQAIDWILKVCLVNFSDGFFSIEFLFVQSMCIVSFFPCIDFISVFLLVA